MSATDALTITSALDALTRYYDAKEREENAVLYINDAYLEALNSLEKLEAENAKLRELVRDMMRYYFMPIAADYRQQCEAELLERAHELGVKKDNGELDAEADE